MVDIASLADSLVDASFRGIPFCIPDIRHETGRRVQRFLFPGQDATAFQDLGALDGPIALRGLIVGDDYVPRMQALVAAFRQAGASTLVHPWLGELLVVARPARFSFDQAKYRLVAFEAELWPFSPDQAALPDTLGALLLAVTGVQTQARALLAQVLRPAAQTIQGIGAAERFVLGLRTSYGALAALQLPGPITAIAGLDVTGTALGTSYAASVASVIAAPAVAAATAASPPLLSAIGPGDAATVPTPADPRATAAALIACAGVVAASGGGPMPALALAAQALMLASAVQVAADIPFTSQQDASAWRGRQDAALAAAAAASAPLAASAPAQVGALWQAIQDLRAALAADMAAAIGRLPRVARIAFPGPAPLWLIAHHLSGATPGAMLARFTDLVARNDIGQPGMVALPAIEALQ